MITFPLSISSDLSEHSLGEALRQLGTTEYLSLTVGTSVVGVARTIVRKSGIKINLYVEPSWKEEWLLKSLYTGIFSESA